MEISNPQKNLGLVRPPLLAMPVFSRGLLHPLCIVQHTLKWPKIFQQYQKVFFIRSYSTQGHRQMSCESNISGEIFQLELSKLPTKVVVS